MAIAEGALPIRLLIKWIKLDLIYSQKIHIFYCNIKSNITYCLLLHFWIAKIKLNLMMLKDTWYSVYTKRT